MSNEFFVEGRYFPNSLFAFTFASIQADRMERPVEVHTGKTSQWAYHGTRNLTSWHATAQPSNSVRRHLVTGL